MSDVPSWHLLDHLPRSQLAEGPLWDAETSRLIWVDILGHAIHRYDPKTGEGATRAVSGLVGFAIPSVEGDLVAGIDGGVHELAFETPGERSIARPSMHEANRFNDGKCDSRGRLWAGTMHRNATREREPSGALYRWRHGGLDLVESSISIANGLGWSPAGDTMYFSDTHEGTVWAYDYHAASGEVQNRRAFAIVPSDVGVPDGLTVDGAGRVFVAIWRGGRVNVYAPSSQLVATLAMPVRNPTSCCFGGDDLKTLFVTTMPASNEADPRSGSVFAFTLEDPGQPSARVDRTL